MKSVIQSVKATNDPIYYDLELPLHGLFHPLGFSLEIATNSKEVLLAAEESWGHFRKIMAEPAVQLRVAVLDGGSKPSTQPPTTRGQWNLLFRVADAENFSVSDMTRGLASCWLTPAMVANRSYLRYHFLEGMGWDLLSPLYLTPIHAACVRKGNSGVLLCGDSGAGKSSLAYACARKGWMFLSDDSACLIRKSSRPIVVGNPFQIRFRDSATELFPELLERKITRRVFGKLSIEVPTVELPAIKTIYESPVGYIVFLRRGQSGPARLVPFSAECAFPWFEQVICYGEESVREAQRAALRKLLKSKMFELHYDGLDSAVALLEDMVGREVDSPVESTRQPIHA
jgi:hypothetical protein